MLQKKNPIIQLVIIPIRRRLESSGVSENVAWLVAQLASWSLKALFALPLWFLGAHEPVKLYWIAVALFGTIAAVAPWFGYVVKPLPSTRDILRKK